MDHRAESIAETLEIQHIMPRVDARLVQLIHTDQMVAHLIGGIAEHQHHLFAAAGNALQQQRKTIAAEDGERDTHRLPAGLGADIGADLLHSGIVALATGHNRLGDGHHILIVGFDTVFAQRVQNGCNSNGHGVIALTENRCAHAARNSTQSSHSSSSFRHFVNCVLQLIIAKHFT